MKLCERVQHETSATIEEDSLEEPATNMIELLSLHYAALSNIRLPWHYHLAKRVENNAMVVQNGVSLLSHHLSRFSRDTILRIEPRVGASKQH